MLKVVTVDRWLGNLHGACQDDVAEEVPVALEYNGISHAVMMASPSDLEDFALGFSMSEGILNAVDELYECEAVEEQDGIRIAMRIAAERLASLKERRRSLVGRTGCGLCGTESLTHALRKLPAVRCDMTIGRAMLQSGVQRMQAMQYLQHQTGASHAAAWMTSDGGIDIVREDVGRHNALDKLIGAGCRSRIDFSSGAAIVTSRASYELVQKAAAMGIGILAAVSAPTSLAIRLAMETGLTLVGFVRQHGHVVYAHPERLT